MKKQRFCSAESKKCPGKGNREKSAIGQLKKHRGHEKKNGCKFFCAFFFFLISVLVSTQIAFAQTFRSSGTFNCTQAGDYNVTVIGGGGGGGNGGSYRVNQLLSGYWKCTGGGGGGAGSVKTGTVTLSVGSYSVVVGGGGGACSNGGSSSFQGISASGGTAGATGTGRENSAAGGSIGGQPAYYRSGSSQGGAGGTNGTGYGSGGNGGNVSGSTRNAGSAGAAGAVIIEKAPDTTPPSLSVSKSTTDWATEVTITASATDTESSIAGYYFDGTFYSTSSSSYSLTYYTNTSVTIKAKDSAGNVSDEQTVTINNIDTTPPSLSEITCDDSTWSASKTITAAASDSHSGITPSSAYAWKYETGSWSTWKGGTITATQNGTYYVKAKDNVGNESDEKSITITHIDGNAPVIDDVVIDPTGWTNGNVTVTINAHDDETELTRSDGAYSFDDGVDGSWQTSPSKVFSANTTTPFIIKVRDEAGNTATWSETISIDKIERDAPILTVTGNPTEWTGENVILTASAVDQPSGSGLRPDGKTYSWNGGDWTDKTTFTVTAEDTIVKVKARDLAGNESAEETIVVGKLDKTSPSLSISKTIGGASAATDSTLWAKSGQNVVVTITASDAKSGVYEYTIDGSTWNNWPTTGGIPDESMTMTYATNIDTVLKINVRDLVGNTTLETPQQVPVRIDHDAPVITSATQAPSDGSEWVTVSDNRWTGKDVKITIESADAGGSGDPEARYSFDGGTTWQTENWTIVSANGTINVAVKDNAENITYQDVVVSGIDKAAPPSPTWVIEYQDDWKNTAKKVTVREINDGVDPVGCGIKSIAVTRNGSPVTFTSISATEITFDAEENGDYQILITDNVGNFVNASVSVSKIERIKPVVSALSQSPTADVWTGGPERKKVTITVTAADTGDDSVRSEVSQYRFDVDGVVGALQPEAFIDVDQNCTVKVFAIDNAGNISDESAAATITIGNIDTDKPIIDDVVKSREAWTNQEVSLTIKAHDVGVSGLKEYSTDNGASWTTWPNGAASVTTPGYAANTNTINIIVRDNSGNVSDLWDSTSIENIDTTLPRDFTFSWEDDWSMTYKDIIVSPIKDDGGSGIASIVVTYEGVVVDNDTFDGETLTFKAWKNGQYTVTVTDGAGNTKAKTENINNIDLVSPTVTEVTQDPASDVWTGGPERNKVTITATAVDNGEAVEKSGIIAFGYKVDGGTIQWKEGPGKENFSVAQNCTIEVFTRDIAGNVSASPAQTVTITIRNIDITAPAKPVISGNPNTWTNQDVTLKFQKPTDYAEDSTTEQSGVKWYRWSSGEEWTEWTGNNEVTKTVGKNQNVTAQVKDLVGHITTADTVSVTRIDKNDPKIQWGANPSGQSTWVKGPVTLRATISDEATSDYAASGIKEYSWNGETAILFTSSSIEYSVKEASTVNLQVTDNAGNTATSSITVSKIDGTAPTLSVMLTAASADRKGVITQLYATDSASGLALTPFCWNYDPENPGAAEWTNEAQRVLQSGKTFCIAARDNVGNVSYQTVKPKAYEMPNGGGNVPMFSQSSMSCSGYILGKTAYLDSVGAAHTYESEPLTMTVQAEPQYGGWMGGYAMLGSTKYPITWDTAGSPELTQEAATGTFTITPESFTATKKNVDLTVHLFEYEDEAKATRINQDTLTATVSIDVTAPITSISLYSDTITITSRDTLAGMESVQYRMQGTETWTDYVAPFELQESGILEVKAQDKVGNESITASVYLTKTGGSAGSSGSPLGEGTSSEEYRSYWFNYYIVGTNDSN